MTLTPRWLHAVLCGAFALLSPRLAHAQLVATPSISLTVVDGGYQGAAGWIGTTDAELVGSWTIGCNVDDGNTTWGWGGMTFVFAKTAGTANEVNASIGSGQLGGESGSTSGTGALDVRGDFAGSKLRAHFAGTFCHNGQMNSPLVDYDAPDILVPPRLVMSFLGAYSGGTQYCQGNACDTEVNTVSVPAGGQLLPSLIPAVHPYGDEYSELHFSGAGLDTTLTSYPDGGGDPATAQWVTPTSPGTLKVWVELQPYGLKSNELDITVTGALGAGGGTGSTGGGSGSSGGGGGSSGGGCSTTGAFSALGLAFLLLRRARQS